MMRQALIAAPLASGLVFAPAAAHAQSAGAQAAQKSERYKLVIQVSDNDPAKWNLALNNARNVQADLGRNNVDIEIVAYGPGLNMLKDDSKGECGRCPAAGGRLDLPGKSAVPPKA
ncbi:MAG: hypothetical protein ACREUO_10540 [Burkholderiales bacterium]